MMNAIAAHEKAVLFVEMPKTKNTIPRTRNIPDALRLSNFILCSWLNLFYQYTLYHIHRLRPVPDEYLFPFSSLDKMNSNLIHMVLIVHGI